jgi:hypothetical protein
MRTNKKEELSEYDKQAAEFLKKTGATISSVYTGHRPYWGGEKEFRATYMVTITREGKPAMAFPFGQSMADSWKFFACSIHASFHKPYDSTTTKKGFVSLHDLFKSAIESGDDTGKGHGRFANYKGISYQIKKQEKNPSDYDILTCLTKYDPGTFENFCSGFGYDTDSRKAEKTYQAVRKEYQALAQIFSSEELEEMAEIQ